MNAKITAAIASTLFTGALACQTPPDRTTDDRRVDARSDRGDAYDPYDEIREAGVEAHKKIATAPTRPMPPMPAPADKKPTTVDDMKPPTIDDTKKTTVDDEMAAANRDAAKKLAADRYERFDIIKNETEMAFAARADTAIARLQTDLDAAKKRTQASTTTDLGDNLADATEALDEAKEDLAELRGKTGKIFDDGRIGVGVAINRAQRQLSNAYEEMAALKM